MGAWSGISGTIYNHEKKKFSIKKAAQEYFEGEDFVVKFDDRSGLLNLVLESEGDNAYKLLNKFRQYLKDCDINYDLEITVRWCN